MLHPTPLTNVVDDSNFIPSFLVASSLVALLFAYWYKKDPLLDAIPTVGFSDPILSYFSALSFFFHGPPMLKQGYEKSGRGLFKYATFQRWMVVTSSPELIEDIKKAPDEVLSLKGQVIELLQTEYTLDLLDVHDDYHVDILRSTLARNIADSFKEFRNALIQSLEASITVHGDDWVKVPVIETTQRVVCESMNFVFVGYPLCRNQDYLTLNLNFAINVVKFASIISVFPKSLKPVVARLLSNLPSQIRQETEFIRPLVEDRFARLEEFGEDWDDKPNDVLMWHMSQAKGIERSLEGLARRMLLVNFAGIHTTSLTFVNVLYRLLSNPEYVEPLRHDVETVVAEEGWTKAGMDKMYKIDSFVRETQRLDNLNWLTVNRLAMRPFKFSNGITIPAGTLVSAPSGVIHKDERFYPNPEEFDGFRFAKLRELNVESSARYQAFSISPDNLTFGYGRHTCPGRAFAINEVKVLLAHMVVTYDIKFEEGKSAPPGLCIGSGRYPTQANAMFRKRQK